MTYESIDKLQLVLSEEVFGYTKDKKKAAGRALGTIVEIITYYLLNEWGLANYLLIERKLPEFGNNEITHNVEFSLHPKKTLLTDTVPSTILPISRSKIIRNSDYLKDIVKEYDKKKAQQLLFSKQGSLITRNGCLMGTKENMVIIALLNSIEDDKANISIAELYVHPFAIIECKRVGVEEGMKKGPQTIEKAKQGAYVARSISSLQKIRDSDGNLYGASPRTDGSFYLKLYQDLIKEVIASSDYDLLRNFVLTIGITSNHGNWFTSENKNKELQVLCQSYDWLLFLEDRGICKFIQDLILNPLQEYKPVKDAFYSSYGPKKIINQFTKVNINYKADQKIKQYFHSNMNDIKNWFNILTPIGKNLDDLKNQIGTLKSKDWFEFINEQNEA